MGRCERVLRRGQEEHGDRQPSAPHEDDHGGPLHLRLVDTLLLRRHKGPLPRRHRGQHLEQQSHGGRGHKGAVARPVHRVHGRGPDDQREEQRLPVQHR